MPCVDHHLDQLRRIISTSRLKLDMNGSASKSRKFATIPQVRMQIANGIVVGLDVIVLGDDLAAHHAIDLPIH